MLCPANLRPAPRSEVFHNDALVLQTNLEKFGTLDRTAKTIYELAEWLKDKPVYVNGENELAKKNALSKHILYGRNGVADWRVENTKTGLHGTSFDFAKGAETFRISSSLLGRHNIGPLIAAADIAFRLGLSERQVVSGLSKTRPFEHRLNPRIDRDGVITLDDSYNGNPDGARAVIDFLATLSEHRRFYVTPGLVEMGDRTEFVHKEIGRRIAKAGIEKVVLISNSVTPFIEKGLTDSGYKGEILWFNDALSAYAALSGMTARGDVVVLQNDWPDQYA